MSITTSPEINEIAGALAMAQAEMENVGKDGTNPHFRSKYATLGAVLDEVRPALAKQGISIIQMPINGERDTTIGVITRLAHKSGQWIQSGLYVVPAKFDAQGAGSVISYLRRYSLMAMAGVWQDDDDGEASLGRAEQRKASAPEPPHPRKADAAEAYARLKTAMNAATTPKMIDELIRANSDVFMPMIKEELPDHYDALMTLASARKTEMYSSA